VKKVFFAAMLVLGISSISFAAPILNVAGDGKEDVGGSAYSYFQNSGTLLFTQAGNVTEGAGGGPNYSVAELQSLLQSKATTLTGIGDFSGVALSLADVSYSSYGDGSSGTWVSDPISNTIEFYAVKAGHYFALYYVNPADSAGSWSTFDIWSIGAPGTGGAGLEISHFIGYNPSSAPVPEPGTIILLGAGIAGLGLYGRRRMRIQG
jgi:hypothetical protein